MSAIAKAIDLAGGPARVAEVVGVSVQAVCFWRDGKRRLPHEHAADLERLTNGQVGRRDMFPDSWARIWPELAEVSEPASTGG